MKKQILILLLLSFISSQTLAHEPKYKAGLVMFGSVLAGVALVYTGLQFSPECNRSTSGGDSTAAVCLSASILIGTGIGWLVTATYSVTVLLNQSKN